MSIINDNNLYLWTSSPSIILDMGEFDAQKFGSLLKRTREAAGLSTTALALRADVSKQYISMLEKGSDQLLTNKPTQPALDKVERLAKAVGADINEFREMAGYDRMDSDEAGLFSGLSRLSPEKQRAAKKHMKALIDTLAEQEHDFDYIDDEEESEESERSRENVTAFQRRS